LCVGKDIILKRVGKDLHIFCHSEVFVDEARFLKGIVKKGKGMALAIRVAREK
jgi:hypothetical protein